MPMSDIIGVGRATLETALMIGAPILIITMLISLVINIVQVLTSIQEATVSTVPRLFATAIAVLLLMPWMLRRMATFTIAVFSDLRPFTH